MNPTLPPADQAAIPSMYGTTEQGLSPNGAHAARRVPHRVPRPVLRAAALALGAIAIQFVMVTAYSWASVSSAPRNVPVAITGPAQEVAAVTGEINLAHPGAFRLIPAASPQQAEADVTGRLAYGAIELTGGAPKMLVAPAASPAVANILTSLADHMTGVASSPVRDIVPASPADPNGTGFAFTVLPIAMSSLAAGILLSLGIRNRFARAAALVAFGVGGGAVSMAVAHTWLHILPGSYPVLAAVAGLAALAAAAGVSGLAHLADRLGRITAGTAIGGALIMLVGNPFSAAGSAPEMLPGAWGMIGQSLPNGALVTLLRSVAYFDGARSAGPWTVLAVWAVAGLMLTLAIPHRRHA
jgi:hypothetical protein